LTNETNLLMWLQHYNVDTPWAPDEAPTTVYDLASPLYYAARIGLVEVIMILLEQKADVNAQRGYYGNALLAASTRGHEKVVQILVKTGADVNAKCRKSSESALYVASCNNNEKIVRILVDAGAVVNAQGGLYGTALQAAS